MLPCVNSLAAFKSRKKASLCVCVSSSLQCATTAASETCTPPGYWRADSGRMRFGYSLQSWAARWVSVHPTLNIKSSLCWTSAVAFFDKQIDSSLVCIYSVLTSCLLFVASRIPSQLRDHTQRYKGIILTGYFMYLFCINDLKGK